MQVNILKSFVSSRAKEEPPRNYRFDCTVRSAYDNNTYNLYNQ